MLFMSLLIGGHASSAYGAIEEGSDKPKIQRFCPTEESIQYKEMILFILAIQDLHEPHNLYMDSLYMSNMTLFPICQGHMSSFMLTLFPIYGYIVEAVEGPSPPHLL